MRQIRTVKFSNYDKGFGIKDGEFELIDTVSDACGAKFAGDVEHAWADYTGILGEKLSARGKAGGRAGTGEKKVAAGRAAAATLTPAQRRANARKAEQQLSRRPRVGNKWPSR